MKVTNRDLLDAVLAGEVWQYDGDRAGRYLTWVTGHEHPYQDVTDEIDAAHCDGLVLAVIRSQGRRMWWLTPKGARTLARLAAPNPLRRVLHGLHCASRVRALHVQIIGAQEEYDRASGAERARLAEVIAELLGLQAAALMMSRTARIASAIGSPEGLLADADAWAVTASDRWAKIARR